MTTPSEQRIPIPAQDSRQAGLTLVIPTVGVVAVAAVATVGVMIYWQATGKDREEVLRIGADKLGELGNDLASQSKAIVDLVGEQLQSRMALAGGAFNAVRGQIETAVKQVLQQLPQQQLPSASSVSNPPVSSYVFDGPPTPTTPIQNTPISPTPAIQAPTVPVLDPATTTTVHPLEQAERQRISNEQIWNEYQDNINKTKYKYAQKERQQEDERQLHLSKLLIKDYSQNDQALIISRAAQSYQQVHPNETLNLNDPRPQNALMWQVNISQSISKLREEGLIGTPNIDAQPRRDLDPNSLNSSNPISPSIPNDTGHNQITNPFNPNDINERNVWTPAIPSNTAHPTPTAPVTDVFEQEILRILRPDGTLSPIPTTPQPAQPSTPLEQGDSGKLARNMEVLRQEYIRNRQSPPEGLKKRDNYAAHHIVEGNDNSIEMQQARAILARHNIGINAGENGVYLPRDSDVSLRETPHANVHTNEYRREVLQRLRQAEQQQWNGNPPTPNQQRQNIINELNRIRHELIQHIFPYRKTELQQNGPAVAQQPTPTEQNPEDSLEFQQQWNALLAENQQLTNTFYSQQHQNQTSLNNHAAAMNTQILAFNQTLAENQTMQTANTQIRSSLQLLYQQRPITTEQLKGENTQETNIPTQDFNTLLAQRNSQLYASVNADLTADQGQLER
jgi:hypothetical protein